MSYAIVTTKNELEEAIKKDVQQIIVTDPDLANHVRTIKSSSPAVLTIAITAAGVGAANFWNPVGWGVGLVAAATSGTVVLAIIALGLGVVLIWALANNYTLRGKCKVTLPNGTAIEAEVVLEKK